MEFWNRNKQQQSHAQSGATQNCDPQQIAINMLVVVPSSASNSNLHSIDSITTAAKSVCKIIIANGLASGSGFFCKFPLTGGGKQRLVGLMTNNHVIGASLLNDQTASFDVCFESERRCSPIRLSIKDDVAWWFTDATLDVTFMQLLPETVTKMLDGKCNIKPLEFFNKSVRQDQEVAVVQYPNGELQKVAFAKVKQISGADFKHTVSTDYGSSGSPVIEVTTWAVVGVHKARSSNPKDQYNWAVSARVVVDAVLNQWRATAGDHRSGRISNNRSSSDNKKARARLDDHVDSVIENYYAPRFHKAATVGSLQAIKDLLREFREEFPQSSNGEMEQRLIDHSNEAYCRRTPLIEAARYGHVKVVRFLVEQCQADVFDVDTGELQSTALHLAAEYGHFEVVSLLLQTEPELLEFGNNLNDTALNMAAYGGHLRVVEYLVNKKGANLENRGEHGRTPLMRATVNGHLPVVKFLTEKGANLEATDLTQHMNSALHLAAYFGHFNVVAYLLSVRPKLAQLQNGLGRVPLYYARLPVDKTDVIRLLEQKTR